MINFPQFRFLKLAGYDLYPGQEETEGLEVDFLNGPWLVFGVNGLGKSTLLLILRFALLGAVRPRRAGFAGQGNNDLQPVNSDFFAVRVADRAKDASVCLKVDFGDSTIEVTRRLSDMKLVQALVSTPNSLDEIEDESAYREALSTVMGLPRFEDVVRVADKVTFLLEDRQLLVWDVAAQFEVFRALLTPKSSSEIRDLEGKIISADSSARNLNAALTKIVRRQNIERQKRFRVGDTTARLAAVEAERDTLRERESKVKLTLEGRELKLEDLHLQLKRAEHEADNAAQVYERIVRHQRFMDRWQLKLGESLAHQLIDIMRPVFGIASAVD